jgi:hypothetical protein
MQVSVAYFYLLVGLSNSQLISDNSFYIDSDEGLVALSKDLQEHLPMYILFMKNKSHHYRKMQTVYSVLIANKITNRSMMAIATEHFSSKSMYVRRAAAQYVGICGNQDDLPAMLMMLNDPDGSIRHLVLHDLQHMGNASTIDALKIYLEQNSQPNDRLPYQKLLNDRIPGVIEAIQKRLAAEKAAKKP